MRSIVVTQSQVQLEGGTEALLFDALTGLERHCDSLRSCRVHLQGGDSSSTRRMPFRVTLLLSTSEHEIEIIACDGTHNALTPRDTILSAIGEAENELRDLKLTKKCNSCCDQ